MSLESKVPFYTQYIFFVPQLGFSVNILLLKSTWELDQVHCLILELFKALWQKLAN